MKKLTIRLTATALERYFEYDNFWMRLYRLGLNSLKKIRFDLSSFIYSFS